MSILIVGAGPTGLFAGIELLRRGIPCRLVDKEVAPLEHSRAVAIQARTLEIFEEVGLLDDFLHVGKKIHGLQAIFSNDRHRRIDFGNIPSRYPFILSVDQSETEKILTKAFKELGGTIEREMELLHFHPQEKGIKAILLNHKTSHEETVVASYLLAADGAHSTIRKQFNLRFEGRSLPQTFSLADAKIDWKYPHDSALSFLTSPRPFVAFPLKESRMWRLVFLLDRCQDPKKISRRSVERNHGQITTLENPSKEEIEKLIHDFADPHSMVEETSWTANFHVNSRLTPAYRVGSVFLMGDAAHIHSPVGGQGMNTGIQDAYNLIWKLDLVRSKKIGERILDSYHIERHAVAKNLLKATEGASKMMLFSSALLRWLRNRILCSIMSFKEVTVKMAQLISEVAIHYESSPWISRNHPFDEGPKAGYRAPDICLSKVDNQWLSDLWKNTLCYNLLIFEEAPSNQTQVELTKYLSQHADLIRIHHILFESAASAYPKDSIYLIRPDGYIAFVGNLTQIKKLSLLIASWRNGFTTSL